jgi:hypothetical protein
MDMLAEENIDAYVADNRFRKRDPRFDNAGRDKERIRKQKKTRLFSKQGFYFDPEFKFCMRPARKRLYRTGNGIDNTFKSAITASHDQKPTAHNYRLHVFFIAYPLCCICV